MRRPLFALVLLALVAAGSGCGKKGSPAPPLPRGPFPPIDVTARQLGDRLQVEFVIPTPRGAKPAQELARIELYRVAFAPGLQPSPDAAVFRRLGESVAVVDAAGEREGSRVSVIDERSSELDDDGRGWTLRYGIRLRDRKGRPSPLVAAEDLVPLEPAGAPTALTAEPTADGVRLAWSAPPLTRDDDDVGFNVYRTNSGAPWPKDPLNAEPVGTTEFLDSTVETGRRYTYSVRVALSPERPYREGHPVPGRDVVAEDRFSPPRPEGLVAVQEGAAVRLFWNPSPATDVAGYRVYRRSSGDDWVGLPGGAVEQPLFRDRGVEVGQRVSYRVTAVDRATPPNESDPSESVVVELLAEPVAPGGQPR